MKTIKETINFNPDDSSNSIRNLSLKFNRQSQKEQSPEEKSPLIRLAKQLNVNPKEITAEKATPALNGKTANDSIEYPTDKQKTFLVNLLSKFNKEQITEYLKNDCRLYIEDTIKYVAENIPQLNQSAFKLYNQLNGAGEHSPEMYQAGEEIADFITNSLIPYLEGLNLEAVSDHGAKKNIQTELAKIAELIEELESVK